ncbi:MAG TPA: glycerol-3-phosphate 1-O-acyltransferase PlsY [Anaeromyxobacter sp.]
MSTTALGLVLVVVGYLAGSIPFGLILARVFLGVDVRTVGSGNIGGTNVARVNKKLGVATILLDALKAVVPLVVARRLLAGAPAGDLWVMAVAIAAFVGHVWTVWLRFQGGKGVATAVGVFFVLAPWAALAGLVTWVATYLVSRMSSLGSLAGTLVCVVGTLWLLGAGSPVAWAAVVIGALIFVRHRENIRRIVNGEEKRRMRV